MNVGNENTLADYCNSVLLMTLMCQSLLRRLWLYTGVVFHSVLSHTEYVHITVLAHAAYNALHCGSWHRQLIIPFMGLCSFFRWFCGKPVSGSEWQFCHFNPQHREFATTGLCFTVQVVKVSQFIPMFLPPVLLRPPSTLCNVLLLSVSLLTTLRINY